MPFSYANPTSGPSAGGIGWFNFGNLTLNPGQSVTGLTGTLNDGTVVTFDIASVNVSGGARIFDAVPVPTYVGAQFGIVGYTGISGQVALDTQLSFVPGSNALIITNIVVKDNLGNPVPNYSVIIADAESTGAAESWVWQTNGGPWKQVAKLGNLSSPTLSGIGTQTATLQGFNVGVANASYLLSTQSPTQLNLTTTTTSTAGGQEGISIGFATTRVRLQKNVGYRINPADQFQLNIGGTPSGTATTAGGANGIQPQQVDLFGIPGNSYSFSEAMAPGSVSTLGDYTQIVSVANATPAGSIPPLGTLPINFTPALGDDVTYTVLNAGPEIFTKTVDKAYADLGDILTYTVSVNNPNSFALNSVQVQDALPTGTTYVDSLTVSVPYTGTDPMSGLVLTTIPANTTAVISWKVQVNSLPPLSNPLANIAQVTVPGGTSGNTNAVTTQVNTAYVTVNKVADKAFANVGDIITYTLMLMNAGNVPASNVVLTDVIPTGTTFVPGSVTGATGTPPTLTLANPIPADGTATVTFQVKVGNTLPAPNPIPNSATVNYTYTVDPANPNGAVGTRGSNTANTQINAAIVTTTKAVSVAYAEFGQILSYTLTLQNTGNVPANNITITDAIPNGTTFVPGSVTGATGVPPTLTLAAPLAPSGTATVTFQVQVGNTTPSPNPILNSANAAYTYTVDPASPNGAIGNAPSNTVTTQVNDANLTTVLAVDKTVSDVGQVLTYTITVTNTGNVPANNVVLTAPDPSGTTFINGSLTGATGTPPTLTIPGAIPAGGSKTVTYQVLIGDTIPVPNPIPQTVTANFTFTLDPANPDGQTGTSTSNTVNTLVNSAIVSTAKTVDKAFATLGDTITYTITVTNSGNVVANNVVLTDALPAGVTFVAGSLTNATGTPPTLTLNAPVPAGDSVVVTYQVKVGNAVPNPNPVENSASAAFTYRVDPAQPNSTSSTSYSNVVGTQVNTAKMVMNKSVDKAVAYLGDTVTYQISATNTGNVPANNVVITDLLNAGLVYVPGSLTVSAPATGDPTTAITLTNPVAAGQTVAISFKAKVDAIPNPNPAVNEAVATYSYVVIPGTEGVPATTQTNAVTTTVFRNNFGQQISDLIESVALEQAALAAIANAEGAKIQRMAAMLGVTPQQLLCLNKSVADLTDSIALLEAVLKQKLGMVDCQIDGTIVC